jgi:iron complex outermembrane recepter protein
MSRDVQCAQRNTMRRRSCPGQFRKIAMALVISGVLPSTAYSQTSGAEEAATSEPPFGDIVVTAQKRSESINKVGMSIGAFDGETLIDKGIGSPADLVKIVPGFSFAKSPRSAPVYTLRGVGFFDDALAGAPTVSVYVDQVPLPFSQMTSGASIDLERVEVLKGPQGTVFGSNATGGAINYIAAKPTDELAIGGDLSFGRFNVLEASAFISGPLSSTLKGRMVFKVEKGDAWQVSQSRPNDRLGKRDRLFGRILLDWQPSDGLSFALNVNGWRDRSDTQAAQYVQTNFVVPPFGAPELVGLQRPPKNNRVAEWDPGQKFDVDNDFAQVSLRADYEVSDSLTLTSISSFSHFKLRSTSDIDGTSYLNMRFTQSGKIESYFQELRADYRPSDEITVQFGGNYQNDRINDSGYNLTNVSSITAVLGNGLADVKAVNETKIKTIAVFGNAELHITPQLKILGGVRYTDAKNDTATCTYDGGLGGFALVQSLVLGVNIPPGGCITSINGTPGVSNYKIYEDNISWRAVD